MLVAWRFEATQTSCNCRCLSPTTRNFLNLVSSTYRIVFRSADHDFQQGGVWSGRRRTPPFPVRNTMDDLGALTSGSTSPSLHARQPSQTMQPTNLSNAGSSCLPSATSSPPRGVSDRSRGLHKLSSPDPRPGFDIQQPPAPEDPVDQPLPTIELGPDYSQTPELNWKATFVVLRHLLKSLFSVYGGSNFKGLLISAQQAIKDSRIASLRDLEWYLVFVGSVSLFLPSLVHVPRQKVDPPSAACRNGQKQERTTLTSVPRLSKTSSRLSVSAAQLLRQSLTRNLMTTRILLHCARGSTKGQAAYPNPRRPTPTAVLCRNPAKLLWKVFDGPGIIPDLPRGNTKPLQIRAMHPYDNKRGHTGHQHRQNLSRNSIPCAQTNSASLAKEAASIHPCCAKTSTQNCGRSSVKVVGIRCFISFLNC